MPQLQYSKVNNAIITLTDTDDLTKGKHFKSRFIQPGLAGYPGQFGNALIKKENLDRFVHTLRNKPVTINHKDKITEEDKKGEVFNVWFNPEDGWYWCDGIITDDEAINLINNGWSVSCAYDFTKADNSGGTENNIPYDIEFLDGEFNHLALVDNPRYEGANIVFNSKVENTFEGHEGREGKVGGSLPRSNNKSMPSIDDYKNPRKDYTLPDIPKAILDKLGKAQKPVILKKNIIEKNKEHHPDIEIEEYNDILEKGINKADIVFKTKENDDYYNFVHRDKDYHPQVLIELSETKENFEVVNFYKLDDKHLEKKLNKAIKRIDNEGGKFLIDIEGEASKVGSLSNLEIDSIYIIPHIENNLTPDIKEHEEIEKLKELKQPEAQNPLTDTILNAIAELITGK